MQLPVSAPSTTFLAASGSLESESTETEGEENLVTRLLPEKRSAERMGPAGLEGFRGQVWKKIAEHEDVMPPSHGGAKFCPRYRQRNQRQQKCVRFGRRRW